MARSSFAFVLVEATVVMMLVQGSMATNYVVGSVLGWSTRGGPRFYQEWVQSNVPYRTGDTLDFQYGPGDSVLLVNQDDFTTCNTMHPIQAWTDGPHAFSLQGFNTYRFISGAPGHCVAGQKFTLDALH